MKGAVNMDWFIGIGAVAIVIWTVIHQFKAGRSNKMGCSGCSGCASKENCHKE